MGAYILRRLLLVIPTLLGIMIINFTLTQFVPGGPIEQIIAQIEGGGDVFEGISGGGSENLDTGSDEGYVGARGLPQEFIEQLVAFNPARAIYVSCNPATQVRDLALLRDAGFTLEKVQPFDLFPHTRHLECVMTLKGRD